MEDRRKDTPKEVDDHINVVTRALEEMSKWLSLAQGFEPVENVDEIGVLSNAVYHIDNANLTIKFSVPVWIY